MKVSYIEDLANHNGSESCVCAGNFIYEALTGGDAGRVLSRERTQIGVPTMCFEKEGNIAYSDIRELCVDPARSEALSMHPSTLYGSREIPLLVTGDAVTRVENSKEAKQR